MRQTKRGISTLAAFVLASCILTLTGCESEEKSFDRSRMFEQTASNVLTPTHDELLTRAENLDQAAKAFCEDKTTDNLTAAREEWKKVKWPVKQMEAWSFGPYRYFGIEIHKNVDKWPGYAEEIEAELSSDATIDQSYVEDLDYTRRVKGYPAIGYLLYGEKNGMSPIEIYKSADGDRRCRYLTALTEHAHGIVQDYRTEWASAGENYIGTYTSAGNNDTFPSQQAAVTEMVSTMIYATNQVSMMKLGKPFGESNGGTPLPDEVEAPYSETSVEHALQTLRGVEMLYTGGDGVGLTDYVQSRQAATDVDAKVKERLQAAKDAVEAIPRPLSSAVQNDRDKVQAAIDAVDQLTVVLEGDVSTLLGVNPTTVQGDND